MLKYLVDSSIQLVVMMILVGMILGFMKNVFGDKAGNLMKISVLTGFVCAALMAVMKTATNRIDTGSWNLGIYYSSFGAFVLFVLSMIIFRRKQNIQALLSGAFLGIITAVQMVYALADYFVYPHTIMLTEDSLLSTNFLTKMSGAAAGLLITLLIGFAADAVARFLKKKEAFFFLCLALAVTSFKQLSTSFSTLLTRRIIPSNHTLFQIAKFSSNHSHFFIYVILGILLVSSVLLILRSFHVKEPYSNPAQHRKIIFRCRKIRRWCITAILGVVVITVLMTVIYRIAYQEVELSPIEECSVEDGALVIPFEMVDDGHLHRFGYETEKGTVIRVIVIKKPNSSSYGIGLDACDICGETGYYEKDGQVVCNLCDVVMNINTIGFKGGCNPIVIDYRIENGKIIIPTEGLLEYESEFK